MSEKEIQNKTTADRQTRQRGGQQLLFLTNIRSIQQTDELKKKIRYAKQKLIGRKFKIRKHPPRFCNSNKIALFYKENGRLKGISIKRIGCNSWTCPNCQLRKALLTKYKLKNIILLNDLSYFLTLTLDPKKIPYKYKNPFYNHTHKYITKLFNHFITVLKRKNKSIKGLKYIWVAEYQKNGNAHLHILLNQYVQIEVIRGIWKHVGGGHMMRIENVKTLEGISNYLTDYIVKGLKHGEDSKGGFHFFERRYSVSMSCDRPTKSTSQIFKGLYDDDLKNALSKIKMGAIYSEITSSNNDLDIIIEEGIIVRTLRAKNDD